MHLQDINVLIYQSSTCFAKQTKQRIF